MISQPLPSFKTQKEEVGSYDNMTESAIIMPSVYEVSAMPGDVKLRRNHYYTFLSDFSVEQNHD